MKPSVFVALLQILCPWSLYQCGRHSTVVWFLFKKEKKEQEKNGEWRVEYDRSITLSFDNIFP